MKQSVHKEIHTGIQPVRVLKLNLTNRLAERNAELIKVLQADYKLAKNICYHSNELPIADNQTPKIDEDGYIHIYETYLSYIWIITYSMFVIYEEGVVIPDQNRVHGKTIKNPNVELLNKAEDLFQYSKSLIKVYSKWDMEYYPNPERYDENSEEGWYIVRANDLFVEAVNFILLHEVAHSELEHIKKIKTINLNEEDIKKLELEADTRALELLKSNNRNNLISDLGICTGIASLLFFNNSFSGGLKHPNIDERLNNIISIVNPDINSPVWPYLTLFIEFWDKQFGLNLKREQFYKNYKEYFYELVNQIK